jgi:hypothetical protein
MLFCCPFLALLCPSSAIYCSYLFHIGSTRAAFPVVVCVSMCYMCGWYGCSCCTVLLVLCISVDLVDFDAPLSDYVVPLFVYVMTVYSYTRIVNIVSIN